jgi:hypothetical protein
MGVGHTSTHHYPHVKLEVRRVYFDDQNLLTVISSDMSHDDATVGVVRLIWLTAVC